MKWVEKSKFLLDSLFSWEMVWEKMNSDMYSRLRERMDKIGVGFSATETGVEIRILKKLFTEEEAQLYLACSQKMEPIAVIAGRAGQDADRIAPVLEQMADKGLLFSSPAKAGGASPTHFAAAPWIPGMMELSSHQMDSELTQLIMQYLSDGFKPKGNFFRIVPVNQEIPVTRLVAPYDDVKEIVKSSDRMLIVPCACCALAERLGMKIDQPRDVCIVFGFFADFHADKGLGRWVTQEEALQILKQCEEEGLVHEISDTEPVEAICNCGKFCGSLRILKNHSRPAEMCLSHYFAQVDLSL